jgi:hypothetical protein
MRYLIPFTMAVVLSGFFPGISYAWTDTGGGDHGGEDWTPACGSEIAGNHTNIGNFSIAAGCTVFVKAWDGANYGTLFIEAITIGIEGTLDGSGKGYRGGSNSEQNRIARGADGESFDGTPGTGGGRGGHYYTSTCCWDGDGGGGGGHGASGEDGQMPNHSPGAGGSYYGNLSDITSFMGSGGGGGGTAWNSDWGSCCYKMGGSGGRGGGVIYLGSDVIKINGTLRVNGVSGSAGQGGSSHGAGGGGGGAGGTILLNGMIINISNAIFSANGGDGGNGGGGYSDTGERGGGGAGGRIKIFYKNLSNTSTTITATGGSSAANGTIYYKDTAIKLVNPEVSPQSAEENTSFTYTVNITKLDGGEVNVSLHILDSSFVEIFTKRMALNDSNALMAGEAQVSVTVPLGIGNYSYYWDAYSTAKPELDHSQTDILEGPLVYTTDYNYETYFEVPVGVNKIIAGVHWYGFSSSAGITLSLNDGTSTYNENEVPTLCREFESVDISLPVISYNVTVYSGYKQLMLLNPQEPSWSLRVLHTNVTRIETDIKLM